MQQAAVAVGVPKDDRFNVDTRKNPWSLVPDHVWQALPVDVCMRIESMIDAMMQPAYAGKDEVLIPLPLTVIHEPVEVPCSYFVVITRRGMESIWINQFRVFLRAVRGDGICSRPISTASSVVDRYPFTVFDHVKIGDHVLRQLFWERLRDEWWKVCNPIFWGQQQKLTEVVVNGGYMNALWFDYVRTVLQAEIMQAKPKLTTVLVPCDDSGSAFMAFTRAGDTAVNVVRLSTPRFGGSLSQSDQSKTVGADLKMVYPNWDFPCVKLADHELFHLVQLPVRNFFRQQIQTAFIRPRMHALGMAFHRRAIACGCDLGRVKKDIMLRIVAFVMEDPKWGYP